MANRPVIGGGSGRHPLLVDEADPELILPDLASRAEALAFVRCGLDPTCRPSKRVLVIFGRAPVLTSHVLGISPATVKRDWTTARVWPHNEISKAEAHDPEQWRQVREVLGEALEQKTEDRPPFLDRACSSNPWLREEVERLLSSSDEARSSFLQSSTLQITLTPGAKLG